MVEIRVRNQGKQIAPHKLEHIFEKFYRLDDSRSSKTGGAGLGLAIAKEIVELHQGTIEAVSNESYTEFIVTLPCLKQENGSDSSVAMIEIDSDEKMTKKKMRAGKKERGKGERKWAKRKKDKSMY